MGPFFSVPAVLGGFPGKRPGGFHVMEKDQKPVFALVPYAGVVPVMATGGALHLTPPCLRKRLMVLENVEVKYSHQN